MAVFDTVVDFIRDCSDEQLKNLANLVIEEENERQRSREKILRNNMFLAIKEYREAFPNNQFWVDYYDDAYYNDYMQINSAKILDMLIKKGKEND